jgi:hypothetical protein
LVGALHGDGVNGAYKAVNSKILIIEPERGWDIYFKEEENLSTSFKW